LHLVSGISQRFPEDSRGLFNVPDISEGLHGKFKLIVVEEHSIRSQISTRRQLDQALSRCLLVRLQLSIRSSLGTMTDLTWTVPDRRLRETVEPVEIDRD
jgi:hypothetical protein